MDITNKCNFNCQHCLNRSADCTVHDFEKELTKQEILDCINQIIKMKPNAICLCGGEPTLNSQHLFIARKLADAGITVNMVSNGSTINMKNISKYEEAGFTFIQISLDSHLELYHDEFRQFKGAFKRAVAAIKTISNSKIRAGIAMTPTKFNVTKFREYFEFVKSIGCTYIRIMPLLPMGRGLDNFVKIEPNAEEYLILHNDIIDFREKGYQIEWGDPLEHLYLATSGKRYTPLNVEIKSTGEIAPSIYLPITVGNVKRHSLSDYWENGLDSIWLHPEVVKLASSVKTLEDFKKISLQTWSILRKEIDIKR